jgi:uncharacterized LabA/DUF88 family protein
MAYVKNKTGVIWLIDGAYLLKGATGRIDLISLRRELQEWSIPQQNGRFDRIIFFNSMKEGDKKQEGFHAWLETMGFDVRLYGLKEMNVKCDCCNIIIKRQVQKGVDVGICTSILELSDEYKRIVLTAGDGDFIDAIHAVQRKFKEVYISGYNGSMSGEFRTDADALRILTI